MNKNFESTILELEENVLKRFEINVNGGTLFLYNVVTNEFWYGNKSALRVLDMLDGKIAVEHIYYKYHKFYPNINFDDIKSSIGSLLDELLQKKFLKITNLEAKNEFV